MVCGAAAGPVRRFRPTGSVAYYEARVGDNHHHVVYRSWGAIAHVDRTPCLTGADASSHEIDAAEVSYRVRCRECVAAAPTPSGG